jgi:hypothetical protein
MAEAFLRAEAAGLKRGDTTAGDGVAKDEDEDESEDVVDDVVGGDGSVMGMGVEFEKGAGMDVDSDLGGSGESEGEEDEEVEEGLDREEEAQETQEEEGLVDEVSAVMENLDDFLGGNWDLDADLAKARTEQARESRGYEDIGGSGGGLSGLMDVGVWD